MKDDWREQHHREVAGKGYYPLDPKYIDEFIKGKARESEGWAIAYALIQLGDCIQGAGSQIGGVDDYTGIMRVGWALEEIMKTLCEKEKRRVKVSEEPEEFGPGVGE